ncbi:YIP1 family protein [Citreicoccus inhibens]|uniref:YIP1 family protein n=1 Tax=Citreicoccus inhibens TaxID=2849499 RepID=UPI001EEF844F|nr:YIP1 family protein [Citreicoccus inhibens]
MSCSSCGASFSRPASPESDAPVCAIHPELQGLRACSRCGSFACAQCLRAAPSGAVLCVQCHERVPSGLLPWDRRAELGTLKAYWQTCLGMLMRPMATLDNARPSGAISDSLLFMVFSVVSGTLSTGLLTVVVMAIFPSVSLDPSVNAGSSRDVLAGISVLMLVGVPLFTLLIQVVNACQDHLLLKFAGTKQPLAVTIRAHALSQAPYIAGVIPFIGSYSAPVWAIGLRVVTYRKLHGVSWGSAAVGALAVPALWCCLFGGGYLAAIFAVGFMANHH